MGPETIIIIVGLATLIVERTYSFMNKIKKSKCCGMHVEMLTKSNASIKTDSESDKIKLPN